MNCRGLEFNLVLRGLESSLYMAVTAWALPTHVTNPANLIIAINVKRYAWGLSSSGLESSWPSPGSCMIKKAGIGWQLISSWILKIRNKNSKSRLTNISPDSISSRDRRLWPSRRSSNRSLTFLPAWKCKVVIIMRQVLEFKERHFTEAVKQKITKRCNTPTKLWWLHTFHTISTCEKVRTCWTSAHLMKTEAK